MNFASLIKTFSHLAATRRTGALLSSSGQYLSAGFEALPSGVAYFWDGLQRRVDPVHPFVVFQYTLAGWGVYEENGLVQRMMPGEAFAAFIPSAHVYRLPLESPGWTYFWIMFNHPYVVERIGQVNTAFGGVTTLDAESVTLARLVRLFEGVCQGGFRDEWAQEAALFEFLWEYERHEHGRRYVSSQRDQLLTEVRSEVIIISKLLAFLIVSANLSTTCSSYQNKP